MFLSLSLMANLNVNKNVVAQTGTKCNIYV